MEARVSSLGAELLDAKHASEALRGEVATVEQVRAALEAEVILLAEPSRNYYYSVGPPDIDITPGIIITQYYYYSDIDITRCVQALAGVEARAGESEARLAESKEKLGESEERAAEGVGRAAGLALELKAAKQALGEGEARAGESEARAAEGVARLEGALDAANKDLDAANEAVGEGVGP